MAEDLSVSPSKLYHNIPPTAHYGGCDAGHNRLLVKEVSELRLRPSDGSEVMGRLLSPGFWGSPASCVSARLMSRRHSAAPFADRDLVLVLTTPGPLTDTLCC